MLPQQHLSSLRDVLLAMIVVAALGHGLSEKDLRLPPPRRLAPLVIFGILAIGYIPVGPSLVQGFLGAKAVIFCAAFAVLVPFFLRREQQLHTLALLVLHHLFRPARASALDDGGASARCGGGIAQCLARSIGSHCHLPDVAAPGSQ